MEASRAIVKTLLYSDIFNFPLKKDEIWFYLISNRKVSYSEFLKALSVPSKFGKKGEYYYISGKEKIVKERIRADSYNKRQIKFARNILLQLAKLSTIKLVGLSGSLALSGAKKEDDVDIFIISKKNTVWITRFISVFYLLIKGVYRRRDEKVTSGKVCLNMLVGEDFVFPKDKQDLYTAHEIAQMLPLFDKDNAYVNFINKNEWIFTYLPNVEAKKQRTKMKTGLMGKLFNSIFKFVFLERFLGILQRIYMGRVGRETIRENILAFHPRDYRRKILKSYKDIQK